MSADDDKPRRVSEDVSVELESASLDMFVESLTEWQSASFAPDWFRDAQNEAKRVGDPSARRREILFATCYAESYLYEWVRDKVLDSSDFNKLTRDLTVYFPNDDKRGVRDQWKELLKNLKCDKLIQNPPDFGEPLWQEFVSLVKLRDGIVHARSSRPGTDQQPADTQAPHPSKTDLDQLSAGWATSVVVTLVEELHRTVGTSAPPYFA